MGQGLGEGEGESVFKGNRVSVWDNKVLEMVSGDGCKTI